MHISHDFDMISTWFQHDFNMIPTWFQHDFNMIWHKLCKLCIIFWDFFEISQELCTHVDLFIPLGPMVQQNYFPKYFPMTIYFSKYFQNFPKNQKKRGRKKTLSILEKLCFSSVRITNLRSLRSLRGSLTRVHSRGPCIPISCLVFLKVGVSSLGLRA